MSIVKRKRERLELENDRPRLRHIVRDDAPRTDEGRSIAVCGMPMPFYWEIGLDGPDPGPVADADCVVCRSLWGDA